MLYILVEGKLSQNVNVYFMVEPNVANAKLDKEELLMTMDKPWMKFKPILYTSSNLNNATWTFFFYPGDVTVGSLDVEPPTNLW